MVDNPVKRPAVDAPAATMLLSPSLQRRPKQLRCQPSMSLLAQSDIKHVREPDTGFLQLLPHDRGVRRNIGRVDCHFPRMVLTGRALSIAVLRLRLLRDGEGLVGPVHRRRLRPALNLGRRDRFHQLGRSLIRVLPYRFEHKARVPSGM
jgi:hypothetical protein